MVIDSELGKPFQNETGLKSASLLLSVQMREASGTKAF